LISTTTSHTHHGRKFFLSAEVASPIDQKQGRLLLLAAVFLIFYATALSISPAVRARSWQVQYLWQHWVALVLWMAVFVVAHRQSARWLPQRDPYLLPIGALLSGWGLMMIWRLSPILGFRQSIWLIIAAGILILGFRLPSDLYLFRRYKYLWLSGGLLLTGLTLILGTNPLGYGPRMWLGCCGVYMQPSEPLKLLLVVYLAAYLADRLFISPDQLNRASTTSLLPLLAPTLFMTGIALLLLVVQRDLGTASIFIFLYTAIVYVTSGRKTILVTGILTLVLAGIAGTLLFDVVRQRMDAWINPWLDPSGGSYQIVQSLLAIANGGLFGRGPGLGSPLLVPVSHSDFIFAALMEENGLIGALGLVLVVALLANRGIRIALNAPDAFRRYLAVGLTIHLVAQSILIIGGNLRLLPLTGVTLPFVSYGGSSLLTSFLSLLLLLIISNQPESRPAALPNPKPYLQLSAFLLAGLTATGLVAGWWTIYRGPALLVRTDNPRRGITDRYVKRGSILDRRNSPLNATNGSSGDYTRQILYPDLSSVIGYTDPKYGQSGLESSMDATLRGQQGNPSSMIWWHHLLYGQPPPGLDIRTSLDLELQRIADEQLSGHSGALVLMDAKTGEILAMASHPTFDANHLAENWENLVKDPNSPLINRATQGLYPPGAALGPFLLADASNQGSLPALPSSLDFTSGDMSLRCSFTPAADNWGNVVANGCPGAVTTLGKLLGTDQLYNLFNTLGFFNTPRLRLPANTALNPLRYTDAQTAALGLQPPNSSAPDQAPEQGLRLSPLQMALAAATLSNQGILPAPNLVTAVNTPQSGWVILSPLSDTNQALFSAAANVTATSLVEQGGTVWQTVSTAPNGPGNTVSWFVGGTPPDWEGRPLALAVVIEEDNPTLVSAIGKSLLQAAMQP
jgi:cell division protein FtsW (lipid II flippase)